MIDYILLLFVVFVFLMVMDFITTEYILKLGGYEKSELLKYVAGKPFWHAIVKIVVIVFVFYFLQFIVIFAGSYSYITNTLLLIFLDIALVYAQVNNVIVIRALQ
jgi:hypothetical protein